MPLYCRGCSERDKQDVRKPLRDFGFAMKTEDQWDEIVSKGMERMCLQCQRLSASGCSEEVAASSLPGSAECKQYCCWCKSEVSEMTDTKQRDADTVLCDACTKLEFKCQKCIKAMGSSVSKPMQSFSLARLLAWKSNRSLGKQAVCLICDSRTQPEQRKETKLEKIRLQ